MPLGLVATSGMPAMSRQQCLCVSMKRVPQQHITIVLEHLVQSPTKPRLSPTSALQLLTLFQTVS